MKSLSLRFGLAVLLVAAAGGTEAQEVLTYQVPPKGIVELVDTLPTPNVEVSPADTSGKRRLLIEPLSGLPPIPTWRSPSCGWRDCDSIRGQMVLAADATLRRCD